jgi:2-haloacid dehalogenase
MTVYRWVMFDADNTLFDFNLAEDTALRGTFAQLGVPFQEAYAGLYHRINAEIWQEFEKKQIGPGALRVERFVRLFRAAGIQGNPADFSLAYLPNLARCSQLMAGAEEVVHILRKQVKLALVTNGLMDVQRPRLEKSSIAGCFEVVAISEEIGVAKPDGRFFQAAFELMGRPLKEDVLLVGDGLSADIQGGNAFGLATCWFNPSGLEPDPRWPARYTIRDLHEVLALVRGEG